VWFRTYMQMFYGSFWLVRLNGCVRRGRQPLLRGREWLFAVPAQMARRVGIMAPLALLVPAIQIYV
jgi:hypothetical protein